ncbi:hypothetical protein V6N13_092997 [Hibiscus sabdariffa]|uniref:Uncharacterized protein n=1 Tax=Hibiscus sabdariffa TaxID=183260 RepID=A0ABR2NQP4_9ROSI
MALMLDINFTVEIAQFLGYSISACAPDCIRVVIARAIRTFTAIGVGMIITLEDAGSGPNGLDASDGDANSGPNGSDASVGLIGLDAKAGDVDNEPFSASAGENNYETNENSSGLDWLGGESFLYDDEDKEIVSIKNKNKVVKRKIKSKTILTEDLEHDVFNDVLGEDGLGAVDDLREDSECDSCTEYLGSLDDNSYETDSEGDSIVKKSNNVVFMLQLFNQDLS